MANPIHRMNIETKDKRSQRKVADSTTKLDKTAKAAHHPYPPTPDRCWLESKRLDLSSIELQKLPRTARRWP